MSTAIIVQARMGSTRLPGKVLKPIMNRPLLAFELERLAVARLAQQIVVATSTNPADDEIARFCEREKVACKRGSEMDVLSRYAEVANEIGATAVVRVTADCPLIDAGLVDLAITTQAQGSYDYVSNMLRPTWPYGMAVEVMTRSALEEANREAADPQEREHVTPFLYRRPERYRLKSLVMSPDLSHHRWTVDTPEDFALVSRILEALHPRNPHFSLGDVVALLAENPAWMEINRHVRQRTVAQTTGKPNVIQD